MVTKEDLIKNVNIPSHKPLSLPEHQIDPDISEQCSKRPLFMSTPPSVNLYALLKVFDIFKHKIRCKIHFYDTSNETKLSNDGIKPPIIKSQSNTFAPKFKKPKVETFFFRIEQDIFSDTLQINYEIDISRTEKQPLNKWGDNMKNTHNDLLLKPQHKDSRFIFVNKKRKMSRLERVILNKLILIRLHYIFIFITSSIVNSMAQPGKNSTLYKMHKPSKTW